MFHFIGWIIAGLISGFVASKIVNKSGEGIILDILLGIVGGVVGGWLVGIFGYHVESGLNIPSIIVAIFGGVIFLILYHAIRRNL